jgi:thymidylate synthase (FAD)
MNTKVSLIGITKPEIPGVETAEELIAYAARVSNPNNQNNSQTATKLLKYLMDNKHWSPFEMVSITMEINTTRDIARQILRHRSFSFQEFSQRYADPTKIGFTQGEARLQDSKNRQNSLELDESFESMTVRAQWQQIQADTINNIVGYYNWAIENGIAKEVARKVLPEGLTNSRMYMAGTLRSWIHYVQIRTHEGTQKEHREVAELCKAILVQEFPSIASLI